MELFNRMDPMKYAFVSLLFFSSLCANEVNGLKEWLKTRIEDCETRKHLLTDSSDIYTYYIVYGKQIAYKEVLSELQKD